MANLCVIYDSKDLEKTRKLILYLKKHWNVWCAEDDIFQGDWEKQVRYQINESDAIIALCSSNTSENNIFKDELRFAQDKNKTIFPFIIEETILPFGFGNLNVTYAIDWNGTEEHQGFQNLKLKIGKCFKFDRSKTLGLNGKILQLPNFIFSLSSYETQISPIDGITLFQHIKPPVALVSAYDLWNIQDKDTLLIELNKLKESDCILFLDSGNYEANRRQNYFSEANPVGWSVEHYWEIASTVPFDLAFSFDHWSRDVDNTEIINNIVDKYNKDRNQIQKSKIQLCPIVHLPNKILKQSISECASQIVSSVVSKLDPVMIAIPERELGDGLIHRVKTVCAIRHQLNNFNRYIPLHLLGTGNPLTIIVLAAAGADSFDGLEWCRTVADYNNLNLFHFQHFDLFSNDFSKCINPKIKNIIENPNATYTLKAISHNLDIFIDLIKTIQDMIHKENIEVVLKSIIPNIGLSIYREIIKCLQ